MHITPVTIITCMTQVKRGTVAVVNMNDIIIISDSTLLVSHMHSLLMPRAAQSYLWLLLDSALHCTWHEKVSLHRQHTFNKRISSIQFKNRVWVTFAASESRWASHSGSVACQQQAWLNIFTQKSSGVLDGFLTRHVGWRIACCWLHELHTYVVCVHMCERELQSLLLSCSKYSLWLFAVGYFVLYVGLFVFGCDFNVSSFSCCCLVHSFLAWSYRSLCLVSALILMLNMLWLTVCSTYFYKLVLHVLFCVLFVCSCVCVWKWVVHCCFSCLDSISFFSFYSLSSTSFSSTY